MTRKPDHPADHPAVRAGEPLTDTELLTRLQRLATPEPPAALRNRIIAAVAAEPGTTAIQGWVNGFGAQLWRPALVACAPLLLGFLLGVQLDPGQQASATAAPDAADYLTLLDWQDTFEEIAADAD